MYSLMVESISQATYWTIPGHFLFLALHLLGVALFAYIVAKRMAPLMRAERDVRFDRPWLRLKMVLKFWLGQWRHPRYRFAGFIHILIFAGFILLFSRAMHLLALGISDETGVRTSGTPGHIYDGVRAYASTVVFLCMVVAAVRRLFFKPARNAVPAGRKDGTPDAIFLLALIALLMAADGAFEASQRAANAPAEFAAALSLPWILQKALLGTAPGALWNIHVGAYFTHELAFFFLLCYRPFGIQFHVETSLFRFLRF